MACCYIRIRRDIIIRAHVIRFRSRLAAILIRELDKASDFIGWLRFLWRTSRPKLWFYWLAEVSTVTAVLRLHFLLHKEAGLEFRAHSLSRLRLSSTLFIETA